MTKKTGLAIIVVLNLVITAFFVFAYFAFTNNMVVTSEPGFYAPYTPMARGGMAGAFYRYLFCVAASLCVQFVMFVFNVSVLQYVEPDHDKKIRMCVYIAAGNFVFLTAISAIIIGLNVY